ncbi:MAG: S1 RNA-binding domain-containing protein [Campylobacterales bacterium]
MGEWVTLPVAKFVEFGLYLDAGNEDEILLPRKYMPKDLSVGDEVRVFLYTDSEDRPIATTLPPKAVVGEFAALRVADIATPGAFLDWDLEKDLLLPHSEQKKPLRKGQFCVVKVLRDELSNRVYASAKLDEHTLRGPGPMQPGDKAELLICDETPLGFTVLADRQRLGMIYKNEIFEPLKIGDIRTGYLKTARPDGKLDFTLRRTGEAAVADASETVLEILRQSGGELPFHYKTDPETVQRIFKLSRKAYKRALTELVERGNIVLDENGMKWVK